ncbi:GerMN domain-containing protein [Micromonospora sp. WMMD1102]|uniref:GerMN domain-containing protein n=1 Tax=Micromonospora sp. WMMD1102 TaxID=3016105 RepID=UPI0024152033|nr:GerMN domain-containing protein [Micromonospora sp. WMMD1102]MDG4787832.1 GerMN domain-containing protein [Micromonospora sp. WMMD1102]
MTRGGSAMTRGGSAVWAGGAATRSRVTVTVVTVLVALAGCGVRPEAVPRPVEPSASRLPPVTVPAASPNGEVGERLYYVRDDRLVVVTRQVPTPSAPAALLTTLLTGPSEQERDAGLGTALTGVDPTTTVRLTGDTATVHVGDRLAEAGRTDEVLAFGQIVCTVVGHPAVNQVTFRHDSEPLGIPRADGSLSQAPLTCHDFGSLLD